MPRELELETRGLSALVDDADYDRVAKFKWYARKDGDYVSRHWKRNGVEGNVLLHREILGEACAGMDIDHADGNPLNNCRGNLRICSHALNLANQKTQTRAKSSAFKGVGWHKRYEKWRAYIKVDRVSKHLGHFPTEAEAALAYNAAALEAWGQYARLNVV